MSQGFIRIERANCSQVFSEHWRQIRLLPQLADSVVILSILDRLVAAEPMAARASMCINNTQWFLFLLHVGQGMQPDTVFKDIGKIAGVKSVTITEHWVPAGRF